MRRADKRERIIHLLTVGDITGVADLAEETGGVITILLQLQFDPASLVHWRAMEAVGLIAQRRPQAIARVIPRLLWSLNEDSASFGWGAAALLGEIGRCNYALVADIIEMLHQFLEDDFSREGMLWGLGRLSQTQPQMVQAAAPRIQACLADANPQVRAYAAWCLGILHYAPAAAPLAKLTGDGAAVVLYDNGSLATTTVGQIAREALQKLPRSEHDGSI